MRSTSDLTKTPLIAYLPGRRVSDLEQIQICISDCSVEKNAQGLLLSAKSYSICFSGLEACGKELRISYLLLRKSRRRSITSLRKCKLYTEIETCSTILSVCSLNALLE